ncbi:MAG TPA: RluA family pseudouridine synthase [Thermoanaerobaculia bacterium]|nr:RluA family pseudouridine synthase [Thermoanaerobaculia bacterium]
MGPSNPPASGARRRYQRDLSADRDVRRFEVGLPDRGSRIDVFLAQRLRWASRARIRRWIEGGRVQVSPAWASPVRASLRLRDGDAVTISLDAEHVDYGTPIVEAAEPLLVVHEDAWLLAVSKPPGCSVHPTRRHRAGSLVELVHRRDRALPGEARHTDGWVPSLCHRLDRDTSGVVLFAKDPMSRAEVGRQIEARAVRKLYLAWVRGEVEGERGRIDLPIGPDPSSVLANRRAVCAPQCGQPALTLWRVLGRFSDRTLLALEPVTGRTHQLRVHLAALGHPILGDALYQSSSRGDLFLRSLRGNSADEAVGTLGHERLALHALRLELRHPALDRRFELYAPPWPDLEPLGLPATGVSAAAFA